jgi:ABC-type sugar transport system permease subunit
MRLRTKEGVYGYLFILPAMIIIGVFMLYPIVMTFWYSFTNYNGTEQNKFDMLFVPEDALQFHFGEFIEDLVPEDSQRLQKGFDAVSMLEFDVGVKLSEEQKASFSNEYFKLDDLMNDFLARKLSDQITVKQFLERYITGKGRGLIAYKPMFTGFTNFMQAFKDPYFWTSLKNTLLFSAIVVPVQTLLALLLAVAANQKIWGHKFFKTTFFIPSVTSSAAISMIFSLIYTKPGILNQMFGVVGIPAVDWLNNPQTALGAVMAMNIWTTAGYFMVTYLAGLQQIPASILQAAQIDGASPRCIFWKIIVPLLKNQTIYIVTMGIISTLQVFDQIYMLIRNLRNVTLSYYIYKNAFEYGEMGYASALGVVLFVLVFVVTFIFKRVYREERVVKEVKR